MISAEEIVALHKARKTARGPLLNRMDEVRRQYDGDLVVPLPEMDENEKPAAVNLLGPGLDGLAQRMASVMPIVSCPPIRPEIEGSRAKARDREMAITGWWDMNDLSLIQRRRFRYMLGYGSGPVTLAPVGSSPLDKRKMPYWRVRNPLCTFAPECDEHEMEPLDCIFAYHRTYKWLDQTFPGKMSLVNQGSNPSPDQRFEVLEYNDADETVLVVLGAPLEVTPTTTQGGLYMPPGQRKPAGAAYVELSRVKNLAGIPLTVIPGRISLTKVMGAFDQITGMFKRAARLDALETIGIQRSIFPPVWAVSHPQDAQQVKIVRHADPKTGVIGEIQHGTIMPIRLDPSQQVPTAIDRIERAERLTAGIPAEMGGESASNIRTARRGEMVLGAAVDMPIQEHQEIMEASLAAETRRAIAIQKAYHKQKTSFYIPSDGKPPAGADMYDPAVTFETDTVFVKYSMPGTDANGQIIAMGQRVGMQEMSLDTMRRMDPAIEDPMAEAAQVEVEGLIKAMLAGMEQQAAQGQGMDPLTIAKLAMTRLRNPNKSLPEVFVQVHEEMQAEQAQNVQAPPDQAAPEAQPGLSQQPPGTAVPPPAPSQQNLQALFSALRGPANQGKPEMALAGPQQGAGP